MLWVIADEENTADEFWDNLDELHPELSTRLRSSDPCALTNDEWERVQRVPGFRDGPEHAQYALIITTPITDQYEDYRHTHALLAAEITHAQKVCAGLQEMIVSMASTARSRDLLDTMDDLTSCVGPLQTVSDTLETRSELARLEIL